MRERRGQEGQSAQRGFPGVVSVQSAADLGRGRGQRITLAQRKQAGGHTKQRNERNLNDLRLGPYERAAENNCVLVLPPAGCVGVLQQ